MSKIDISFLDLHNPLFMNGVNYGNKIDVKQKGGIVYRDSELQCYVAQFKGRAQIIELANVASAGVTNSGDLSLSKEALESTAPPAIAKARRNQAQQQETAQVYDPNDESAEAHRARIRAASAGANRPDPSLRQQDDLLIQESRNAAMGLKHKQPPTAQVSTPTSGVQGKAKNLSHAQTKTESKEAF